MKDKFQTPEISDGATEAVYTSRANRLGSQVHKHVSTREGLVPVSPQSL
jgi:hypothetical protein